MRLASSINLDLKDAHVVYYPHFFNSDEAHDYFENLLVTLNWKQDTITLFGKKHLQPRLTAFYAENNKIYKYSNLIMRPEVFEGDLLKIKRILEDELNVKFTSCLANLYRDGKDSNGWHADNEKELGKNPIIASVSLGAERIFQMKHKNDRALKTKLILQHGSLLLMKGETQHFWLHHIPKTTKDVGKRINLTFRIIP